MKKFSWLPIAAWISWLVLTPAALAQTRPYIGFAYPAGGRQGTTFQVKVGGQVLEGVDRVYVSGSGVRARVLEYHRRLTPQDMTLLREQASELRKASRAAKGTSSNNDATQVLKERIEKRVAEYVNRPACVSIANIAIIEITMAPDAVPGERELRLGTPWGISNPLNFYVGQLPEFSRKPMGTCEVQVLGKEELALRKRADSENESTITIPCTVNGQLGSGEVHRYRFTARQGQQLVISTLARQLIPYIADAVPGWVQPVLTLHDGTGKEVAYVDDFRFKPDPIIFYTVPANGEYLFTINDSIYRGREDFIYRITVGELPYVTSIFPLGTRAGNPVAITMKGANLGTAQMAPPAKTAEPGVYQLAAVKDRIALNRMPFVVDALPDTLEQEPNDTLEQAQKVTLPIIINGRINRTDDWDVYQFAGHMGDVIVAEVMARRLESPLDSILKLTDATGNILAFNDDREDLGAGVNTHHADSYVTFTLPADGNYFAHLGDTDRSGGDEYGYRLRLSAPQPDFALRVVPSSVTLRGKSSASVSIHAIRKDGYVGPIQVGLLNPPKGITASMITVSPTQQVAQLTLKANWLPTREPVSFNLSIGGMARIAGREVAHEAVPAEDRMQAFLWRHLVPTTEFKVEVINPNYIPPAKRLPVMIASVAAKTAAKTKASSAEGETQKFTKKQVAGRLRDLRLLFEEGLLTSEFYYVKVAECEAAK